MCIPRAFLLAGYNDAVDLNAVRLCFQAFLPDAKTKKFSTILTPIVSNQIFDKSK